MFDGDEVLEDVVFFPVPHLLETHKEMIQFIRVCREMERSGVIDLCSDWI